MKLHKFLLFFILLLSTTFSLNAQSRNFYHRIEIGSGNLYSFVAGNLIAGFANYYTHSVLFDNSFTYTLFSGKTDLGSVKTKPENLIGITARDLFNDISGGVKLGYNSDNFDNFNWGVYGSLYYKLNQFKSLWHTNAEYTRERFSYLKPGIGFFALFGSIEQKVKYQLEAGIQYCCPIAYTGVFGSKTNTLNSGIGSHYAIKIGGATDFSCGIYVDLYHFDLYKKEYCKKFKMYNLGVTFTITPKRSERYYN